MIHVYCGDGKGKTTAAMGLALRALGAGWSVCVVQFLKTGASCEMNLLREHPNATVLAGKASPKFVSRMDEEELSATRQLHELHLRQAEALVAAGKADLLVLDEALGALDAGVINERALRRLMDRAAGSLVGENLADMTSRLVNGGPRTGGTHGLELVLTGREAPEFVREAADYLTEMNCVRHPLKRGIRARKGVEF